MVVGLLIMAVGAFLFLPAASAASYPLFLAALIRLLSEPSTRTRLGEAGRERVRELYALERMVEGTTAVYARLLGR